ncbi:MAG: outer membrane protein assembly factor BamE [Candidatus Omnitrophica bacterium]|nr:outer membrane protein assembly factor BamE [Candidatus Omnitrophota bacterium]
MKKVIGLFLIICVFIFCEEKIKKEIDIEEVIEKIDEIEKRVDEIDKKIEEIEKKIIKINENFDDIRKTIRNFQIYLQPQATLKPTEEEWKSIKNGMEKEEVEKILGSPEEIKKMRDKTEIWYYFGIGRIIFNQNGKVIRIEEDKYTPATRIR